MPEGRACLHDRKLVSAKPCHRIALADTRAETTGNFLQQIIADRMPQRVIDFLEMIKVEAKHGQASIAVHSAKCLFEFLAKLRSIRQARQRIMVRQIRELFLGLPPCGYVLEGRYPTAADHRLFDHSDRPAFEGLHDPHRGFSQTHVCQNSRKDFLGFIWKVTRSLSQFEQIEQGLPLNGRIRHASHPGVSFVAKDDAAVCVKHGQSLRHVLQRGIQKYPLLT